MKISKAITNLVEYTSMNDEAEDLCSLIYDGQTIKDLLSHVYISQLIVQAFLDDSLESVESKNEFVKDDLTKLILQEIDEPFVLSGLLKELSEIQFITEEDLDIKLAIQ
jgi:hypothetical protein